MACNGLFVAVFLRSDRFCISLVHRMGVYAHCSLPPIPPQHPLLPAGRSIEAEPCPPIQTIWCLVHAFWNQLYWTMDLADNAGIKIWLFQRHPKVHQNLRQTDGAAKGNNKKHAQLIKMRYLLGRLTFMPTRRVFKGRCHGCLICAR